MNNLKFKNFLNFVAQKVGNNKTRCKTYIFTCISARFNITSSPLFVTRRGQGVQGILKSVILLNIKLHDTEWVGFKFEI